MIVVTLLHPSYREPELEAPQLPRPDRGRGGADHVAGERDGAVLRLRRASVRRQPTFAATGRVSDNGSSVNPPGRVRASFYPPPLPKNRATAPSSTATPEGVAGDHLRRSPAAGHLYRGRRRAPPHELRGKPPPAGVRRDAREASPLREGLEPLVDTVGADWTRCRIYRCRDDVPGRERGAGEPAGSANSPGEPAGSANGHVRRRLQRGLPRVRNQAELSGPNATSSRAGLSASRGSRVGVERRHGSASMAGRMSKRGSPGDRSSRFRMRRSRRASTGSCVLARDGRGPASPDGGSPTSSWTDEGRPYGADPLQLHQHASAGDRRSRVPVLGDDGGLSPLVRRARAGVAGVREWAAVRRRLNPAIRWNARRRVRRRTSTPGYLQRHRWSTL